MDSNIETILSKQNQEDSCSKKEYFFNDEKQMFFWFETLLVKPLVSKKMKQIQNTIEVELSEGLNVNLSLITRIS